MQLLGVLVFDHHQRDRGRPFRADRGEDLENVVGDPEVAFLGAADFVVAELELDRQPVPTFVGESDLQRLHQVVEGNVVDLSRFEHADGSGEPAPAAVEAVAKLFDVVVDAHVPRAGGVEVRRIAAAGLSDADLHRYAAFHDPVREHLRDDGARDRPLYPAERLLALLRDVADPRLERVEVAWSLSS